MVEKIPIVGIDNSGKTSLIRTFQREFGELATLKPTKGIERTSVKFLDTDLILWDYGGQVNFRNKYLRLADMHFSDLEEMFFVVDIQDQASLQESLEYFQIIKDALVDYSPDVHLNLVMHKYDPGMEHDSNWKGMISTVAQKFMKMAEPLPTTVYETSIFNPLSVIHAFSKAIIGNSELAETISDALGDFVKINKYHDQVDLVLCYSDNLVEIGSFIKGDVEQSTLKDAAFDIFAAFEPKMLSLQSGEFEIENEHMELLVHRVKGKENTDTNFYILVGYHPHMVHNVLELKDKVKILRIQLEKLIKMM
ncbi:MAG: ADP-ribosylation factor-like protein [Promethearchaeota archaeon]